MKYCSHCGSPVELRLPPDDNRHRHVCTACGEIHYENPKLIVGAVPVWQDKILLCRRAIEPRHGLWTLPAGFMENGETTAEAAARETLEEANARVAVGELYTLYNLPHINQVHLLFRAELLDLDFSPGAESLEVRLFAEDEIPWDTLAFRPVRFTLQHYFADRKLGEFRFRTGDLAASGQHA
ncbi:MAG: NUDIX hydrolase [Nitrosomonadales bacterium]|nr:NUDIX hydrolase [Nitrosomonadales bacterium]